MIVLVELFSMIGWLAVSVALWVVARLSYRLGTVTRARPYYRLLYVAAILVGLGSLMIAFARIEWSSEVSYFSFPEAVFNLGELCLALGLSLGLAVTWYYWSWLLAERD